MPDQVTPDPIRAPRRRRRRPVAALLVGVLASVVAGACSSTAEPTATTAPAVGEPPSGPSASTLAIVGDSITDNSQEELRSRLSDRWTVTIDGRPGFTLAEQTPAAVDLADAGPARMIVNLGTNDVLRGRPTEEFTADLQALLADLEDVRCLYLVNLAEGIEWDGQDRRRGAAEANAALEATVAEDDRIRLIDWAAEVRRSEAEGSPLLYDTVHPNETGRLRLAALYDEALQGGCGG